MQSADGRDWLQALRVYSAILLLGNLLWEIAQLPLYTLWRTAAPRAIAFSVLHCTAGDVMIGMSALLMAVIVVGGSGWPQRRFARVVVVTIAIGLLYTIYSEWLNVEMRRTWAYADIMPRLPWLGTGLAPLAQWVVVPSLAFWRMVSPRQSGEHVGAS